MKTPKVELRREDFVFQEGLEPVDWPSVAPDPTDQISACEGIAIDFEYARRVDAAFFAFNPDWCHSVRPAYVGEIVAQRHHSGRQRAACAVVACQFDGYYLRRRIIPIPQEEFSLFGFTWKDEATAKEYFNRVAPDAVEERLCIEDFLVVLAEQKLLAAAEAMGLDTAPVSDSALSTADIFTIVYDTLCRTQMVLFSAVSLIDRQTPSGKSYAWYREALLAHAFELCSPASDQTAGLGPVLSGKKTERR